ncbi:uncharacterized protein DUF397 [Streptomyces sp. BK022]|uniref:DUF397 domain-containing protein n=1 Tax=Streptomyces sp. BK022 TaxID=2512123 RepID=UPI0010298D9A|nr:DUF397 domain-containing protein [Streptomyces sp. BK022]RZU36048.1 uncharacterized protein DUF397 [Streptomyces sp. BK022]
MQGNDDKLVWKKSSFSNGAGECVEVADTDGARYVRDSKDTAGPILGFPTSAWGAFVEGVKDGQYSA